MAQLDDIRKKALDLIEKASDRNTLEEADLAIFGRKQGMLTKVLRSLKDMSDADRKRVGGEANILQRELHEVLAEKKQSIRHASLTKQLEKEKIDVTRPGMDSAEGHLHPTTLIRRELERIFHAMGFSTVLGPEVDSEFYNFDALNIPAYHPARDMQDTFWLTLPQKKNPKQNFLPRTHISTVQVRHLESHNPPFRIIAPGTVFRNEATDASHDFQYTYMEGMMVGKNVSVADLKHILQVAMQKLFGSRLQVRLRPSYFPFVEPGFEVDISCTRCKQKGCPVCKRSGWVEVLGAGMVHQNVFKAAGYVPGEYVGFAFGVGLDRLALMKYKIPDIRLMRGNDVRFLKQF